MSTKEDLKETVDLLSLINQLEIKASNSNVQLIYSIIGYLQQKISDINKELNSREGG